MNKKKYINYGNIFVSEKEAKYIAEHRMQNLIICLVIAAVMLFFVPIISLIAAIVGLILYLVAPAYKKALEGPRYTQTGEIIEE